jgi:hypothetical protein
MKDFRLPLVMSHGEFYWIPWFGLWLDLIMVIDMVMVSSAESLPCSLATSPGAWTMEAVPDF